MMDFRELIKAGVHFGHVKARQCPKMLPYVWGVKNDVQLINVAQTAYCVEEAARFLEKLAGEGKQILWVGTKKSAQKAIFDAAVSVNMPHVTHRWIGGTLSNFGQVKKSVTRYLHLLDIIERAEKYPYYTKKEINGFIKIVERLKKSVGGIEKLTWPVAAIVVVDVTKEFSAVHEASMMGIPVVAIVDTNGDPSKVDYVIPANDDASRSVEIITQYLAQRVAAGVAVAAKNVAEGKLKLENQDAAVSTEDVVDMHIPGFSEDDLDVADPRSAANRGEAAGAGKNGKSKRVFSEDGGRARNRGKRDGAEGSSRGERKLPKKSI